MEIKITPMRKILLSFFMLTFLFSNAQLDVFDAYPPSQEAYYGGLIGLYKDIHNVLIEEDFSTCENKNEHYRVVVMVKPDSKVSFVKDFDTININNNKCAYDLSKKVLPHLKRWKPAEVNKEKVSALFTFEFFPDDLKQNYVENYKNPYANRTEAQFPGGLKKFREIFSSIFNLNIIKEVSETKIIIQFMVDEKGQISNIEVFGGDEEVKKEVINTISRIKDKWTPATVRSVPIKSKYKFPITLSVEANPFPEQEQNRDINRYRNY